MRVVIDEEVLNRFPGVRLGVVIANGVNNSGKNIFVDFLRQEEGRVKKEFEGQEVSQHPFIAPWREIYRSFGAKPSEFNSSVEALVKRVVKGKELSDINPLVNLYNALSLKYVLPFGGEDLDKVVGDIHLAIAKGNEKGVYLGSEEEVTCDVGEIAYLDDEGFICRRWNWREGKRTMLTEKTKNVILVIEAGSAVSDEILHQATEEMARLVKENLGGEMTIKYLSSGDLDFELP